jgi:DNA-binding CsgD family transcriptional regulator
MRMLELLATGTPTREIASRMGYVEGTVRVYLHNLYRKLGVANRTGALAWYFARQRQAGAGVAAEEAPADAAAEAFGDYAVREGLDAALGSMGIFLGPQGRPWEVAMRLKGQVLDAEARRSRDRTRVLWRALLAGDFGYGKQLYDQGDADAQTAERPAEAVLVAMLLILGGYSTAARKLLARIRRAQKRGGGVSVRETTLLAALAAAADAGAQPALLSLHQLATQQASPAPLRQMAMVGLYHAYRAHKDFARARRTAQAIWSTAEGVRKELESMGDRYFGFENPLPGPGKSQARTTAPREKATAAR